MSVYFKWIIWIFILLILRFFYHLAAPIWHHFINRSIFLCMTKISSLWLHVFILMQNCCCIFRRSVILFTSSYHIATAWWLALIITHFVTNSDHIATTGWLTLIITNSLYVASCTSFTPPILYSNHIAPTTDWTLIIRYLSIIIDSKKLAVLFRS